MTEAISDIPRGFAGIHALGSDIEAVLFDALDAGNTNVEPIAKQSHHAEAAHAAPKTEPWCPTAPPRRSRAKLYWIIAISSIVSVNAIIWVAERMQANEEGPALMPVRHAPAAAATKAPSRPIESVPPAGDGLVLNRQQITYCLAENMRIEGARGIADAASQNDIAQFNAKVTSFNGRCASFKYRESELASLEAALEPWRKEITTEGEYAFLAQRLSQRKRQ